MPPENLEKKAQGQKNSKNKPPKSGLSKAASSPVDKKSIKKSAETGKRPSFFIKARDFLREVKIELQKVVWPSKKETIQSTIAVLVVVFLASIYIGLADVILSWLLKLIVVIA